MKEFVKQHSVALVLALLFGLLSAGPFFLYAADSPSPTSPVIYPEITNDQNFYLSRIQEVRDGYTSSGNTYLAEFKDTPPVQHYIGERVSAGILDILDLETGSALFLFPILFLPLLFLLLYTLFFLAGAHRTHALVGAALICFGLHFQVFARPISPQFNLIFWILACISLYITVNKPSKMSALGGAFSFGLLFYIYPYYWTHLAVVYVLLLSYYALTKNRTIVLSLSFSFIGGLLLSVWYWLDQIRLRTIPYYQESLERIGLVYTRFPSGGTALISGVITTCAALFACWKMRVKMTDSLVVSLSLLIGGLVAMNHHIVTGMNLEFSSHYALLVVIGIVATILSLIKDLRPPSQTVHRSAVGILIVYVVAISIGQVTQPFADMNRFIHADDKHAVVAQVIVWLVANQPEAQTVYAPREISYVIPAYTSHNVFFARAASFFLLPEGEVRIRQLVQDYRAHLDEAFITERQREYFGQRFMNPRSHALQKKKWLGPLYTAPLPPEIPNEAIESLNALATIVRQTSFLTYMKGYKVDIVIDDTSRSDDITDVDTASLSLLTVIENYAIYAVPD